MENKYWFLLSYLSDYNQSIISHNVIRISAGSGELHFIRKLSVDYITYSFFVQPKTMDA